MDILDEADGIRHRLFVFLKRICVREIPIIRTKVLESLDKQMFDGYNINKHRCANL